jgi:AbrB family looped-hinge helix DNA binding protein
MAIFRVMYYSTITVGSGGRITIPQDMREDLRIEDGDALTVRLEEADGGTRQITVWKSEGDARG